MKKTIIILAAATLIFSSCNKSNNQSEGNSPTPTPSGTVSSENSASPSESTETGEKKEEPVGTPIGAEKAIEDLEKEADGSMSGEGVYMGKNTEDLIIIMEKGKGTEPEINKYHVADTADVEKLEIQASVKFKFKVIDGNNTITSFE